VYELSPGKVYFSDIERKKDYQQAKRAVPSNIEGAGSVVSETGKLLLLFFVRVICQALLMGLACAINQFGEARTSPIKQNSPNTIC